MEGVVRAAGNNEGGRDRRRQQRTTKGDEEDKDIKGEEQYVGFESLYLIFDRWEGWGKRSAGDERWVS